ncbi:2-oxoglutarate dehydrogenase E1 component [Solemya velum gill symbiont]|uniref:2-oxoglutarate dehydrogenase E1 component n=1 Tax=Solemya velum gill symbiont TaxID=2340 RepID=UPI000996221C|nr:2-oxoglutarate dehydrogenase E1 component [Solemya velum gill symbiont]OOZ73632.1 2-oxoglutarate dehydrogenase E1 component [Solemya velum gill symbiont]
MASLFEELRKSSTYNGTNANFIEALYEEYLEDPDSTPDEWRVKFDALSIGSETVETPHSPIREHFETLAKSPASRSNMGITPAAAHKQASVLRLINAYRVRGHQNADLDPLKLRPQLELTELLPATHDLGPEDMETEFNTGSLYAPEQLKLKDIIEHVRGAYVGKIGAEYMHITETAEKRWLQKRLEGYKGTPVLEKEDKLWLLKTLTASEGLERYLHNRYVGQKRFSLEGGESLIPLLDEVIQRAGNSEVEEVVIGMAHRGRLNVLVNIMGKSPSVLFDEFEGKKKAQGIVTAGDVKYHGGFSSNVETPGGKVHIALGFNPSHLEIINPVIEGSVKARQDRRMDAEGNNVMAICIHGDAAFAGQGVVMETMQMSQARGFYTGGTIHIVVNNQIGFTISNPLDSRSTHYCTDIGKMIQAPILHVNGDDPEAVIFATRLATDYRTTFKKDVIIDLVCYRRLGHNEADEPAVTQPVMYDKIRSHPTTRTLYAEKLIAEGIITPDESTAMASDCRDILDRGESLTRPAIKNQQSPYRVDWDKYREAEITDDWDTGVDGDKLAELAFDQLRLPEEFVPHRRIQKILDDRRRMADDEISCDWGYAENLAYASLLDDGFHIRLCGQDAGRGTFFHRHAVLHDQKTGNAFIPLKNHDNENGHGHFTVIDSLLSEEAVLGFEYGYATAFPETLVIWEAQFGDFANVAQVVIDQFITSAGSKWGLHSGLTLLLPHGQEGQGAEHSSARLERYLQLCAEKNIQVCVPTTPAQIFHLLRRQMVRPLRRPLVVMSPKSLLRHPLAVSKLKFFDEGRCFQTVIKEPDPIQPEAVERVVLCSGKIYYELVQSRRSQNMENVALVRVEQLYPFPDERVSEAIAPYTNCKEYIWCQEEPQNQGAWDQVKHRLFNVVPKNSPLYYVGRPASAAPATGYPYLHQMQQETLVDDALAGYINPQMNKRHV